jgi:hypothetical protein
MYIMKFEMTVHITVFWVVTLCSLVDTFRRKLLPPFHAFKLNETGFSETSQSFRMHGVMYQKTVGLIFELLVYFYL